jgi:diguanylate cyclase (GGDEF)-like protein
MIGGTWKMGKSVYALVWPTATGLAYYAAAVTALALTKGQDGIATVWPSSGVLVAALLLCRREAWPIQLIAAAVASLVANLGLGNSVGASLGFTLANVAESFICAWLLMRNNAERPFSARSADIAAFFLMASLSSFVSASLASLFAPNQSPVFWFSWFSTDLLGILLVTPLILTVGWSVKRGRLLPRHQTIGQIAGMFALVVAVSVFTFSQSKFPLLFLPMLTILAAVFRLGVLGAAGGVLIVAIVSSAAITMHSGPEALIDADPMTRSLFLQFYLLSLFAASLPIAVLLGARRRLVNQISENIRLLQLAETVANVGHWRLDLTTQAISWSPEVFKIHGMHDARPPAYDAAIDAYHPDDQGFVQAKLADAIDHHRGFEFRARIVRPCGQIRYVFSRGEFDGGTSDRPLGLFGVIQDITTQVAYEEKLREAAELAAQAADQAQILAETDQLTGIANRRRVTVFLEKAIADAQSSNGTLSIAVLDIDHFKAINDRYGHMAGDQVICRVATDASRQLRSDDMLGRIGGEEFVIVFPHADAYIAMMIAERVRKAVEASHSNPSVTISTGVAQWARGETSDSLLRRADDALYAAKRAGRNVLRLSA